jgi:general transcription factor 3C polypeptide 3 (transcription factor C subunit 4)
VDISELIRMTVCALISNDEETCVGVARFFMKYYQFTTDSYRMFAAITRMCHSPISWYCSGPSQKFILRQIKAMDYVLVDEEDRQKYFAEKGSYSGQDEHGNVVINEDMDIALLMLYGHMLSSGGSNNYALSRLLDEHMLPFAYLLRTDYFFRAYALDPDNAMINLNIGLAYVHLALKRQCENRQHSILQSLTFMLRYYELRKESEHLEERQEAHFNMGRTYHMLGLVHLAVPYYTKVIEEISKDGKLSEREDLVIDTAYNLQTIYTMVGNIELAETVTRDWLVI